jgi:ElaB/YqjD/DUF883 family membrane-anchored ribosome-binding protein
MTKLISTGEQPRTASSSVVHEVADELQQRIGNVAHKGEALERSLRARGMLASEKALELRAQARSKASQLRHGVEKITSDNPWTVVGSALALGMLIGALSARR